MGRGSQGLLFLSGYFIYYMQFSNLPLLPGNFPGKMDAVKEINKIYGYLLINYRKCLAVSLLYFIISHFLKDFKYYLSNRPNKKDLNLLAMHIN